MIGPPRYKRTELGLYPECVGCGEKRHCAFPEDRVDERTKCLNCIAPPEQRRGKCVCCDRCNVPLEGHHPFGRKLQAAIGEDFANFIVDFCNACHGVISDFLLPFVQRQSKLNGDKAVTARLFREIALANSIFFFQPHRAEKIRALMIGIDSHGRKKRRPRRANREHQSQGGGAGASLLHGSGG